MALRSQMEGFQEALKKALDAAYLSREQISKMKGVSRDLNRAVQRTMRAVDGIIEEFALGESYLARMLNLINGRLGAEGGETKESTSA